MFPTLLVILLVEQERWNDRIENVQLRKRRRRAGGNGRQRAAGRDGSDRCGVGFRRAGMGRKAQRGRTKRGTRWPCAWVHPALSCPSPTREPESQRWVINTSPGHSHHSGFITLFSALIPLLSADTALYWGWQWNWWWQGEQSYQCFISGIYMGNNTGGVSHVIPREVLKIGDKEFITVLWTASI